MITFLYIFAKTIQIILGLVSFAMLLRFILPIFVNPEENRFYLFLALISEPFILPLRALFAKLGIGQNSMFDWPFFVTYILIGLLEALLPVI